MIVERFLAWIKTATASQRASAVHMLTRAYLYSKMTPSDRESAEAALTILLEDASPKVRLALADALGSAKHAPRHLVLMLAQDQTDIATIILLRSQVFLDAELVEIIAQDNVALQIAIACRPFRCLTVEMALAEIAAPEACVALLMNDRLILCNEAMYHIAKRHGNDPDIRDLLLVRSNLPANIRFMLINQLGTILQNLTINRNWLPEQRAKKLNRESCDRAMIESALHLDQAALCGLVRHVIDEGRMNASFLLRAICSGNIGLFNLSLSILSKTSLNHVNGIIAEGNETAFSAVYKKSGLPYGGFSIFMSAMISWHLAGQLREKISYTKLSHLVMQEILRNHKPIGGKNAPIESELIILLRRLATEAACDNARAHVEEITRAA